MENLKITNLFTDFIRNSLEIDLDIVKEDDYTYQIHQEKLRKILSNYEFKTVDFLSILVEELSKQTKIQWKYEIVEEKGIDSIYLVADLLGAKIFFAKEDSRRESRETKNTFFESINVDNVLDNDFAPFIKKIVYDIYLNYININRVLIINTYAEALQETIKISLESKVATEEHIAELEKKIELLRQEAAATNITEEQFKNHISNFNKGEDYKKYLKYPTSSTMSNIKGNIESAKKDISLSSLKLGKNNSWDLGGDWEPFEDLEKIHIYINDTPPLEIYYVFSLYTEYIKNLIINFSENHQIEAKKNIIVRYGIENFKSINNDIFSIENEASKNVEFMIADEKTGEVKSITFSELQKVFKQITDFIEKIKTYDLTSPNHKKYAGDFYETFYCTYGYEVSEELQKDFMENAFIEGEGSEWKKDAILRPCELILKLIALITKFVENVDKYNEKVEFDDNRFQFYHDVFKRYKKYLEYSKEIASIENNELFLLIASLQAQNNVIEMLEKLLANMPKDTLTDTEANVSLQNSDIMRRVRKRLDNPNECEQLSLY